MTREEAASETRMGLGPVIWLFVVWKAAGVLLSAALLAFTVVFLIPTQARLTDGGIDPDTVLRAALLVAEIVATVFGLVLILRRHHRMRRFWIVFLALSVSVLVWDLVFGSGEETLFVFIATSLGWLLYWMAAKKPKELEFAPMWSNR